MTKKTEAIFKSIIKQVVNTLSLNEIEEMLREYDINLFSKIFKKTLLKEIKKKKMINCIACDYFRNSRERCMAIKEINDLNVLYDIVSSEKEDEVIRSVAASRIYALDMKIDDDE